MNKKIPSKTTKPKVTEAIKAVQRSNPKAKVMIKGIKVDGNAVLNEIVHSTKAYILKHVRSFMNYKQNHQIRNQCVIENIQPYMCHVLKGEMKKTRQTYGYLKFLLFIFDIWFKNLFIFRWNFDLNLINQIIFNYYLTEWNK